MMRFGLSLFIVVLGPRVAAAPSGDLPKSPPPLVCEPALTQKEYHVEYRPSGSRDANLHDRKQRLISFLGGPNGLYARLGLEMPKFHLIEDMEGGNLVNLVAQNGYPRPLWMDGQSIVRARRTMGGVMEFVPPGSAETRTVFNRDDLSFYDWAAVQFHASGGHVNFGATTRFDQSRAADLVRDSHKLSQFIADTKRHHNPDEVDLWFQFLESLQYAQDVVAGTYQLPDELVRPPDNTSSNLLHRGENPGRYIHPRSPTTSVLQAFVANLPPELPQWKKHAAREFERMSRYITGAIKTKIMNEGWAMLMEELIPPHIDDPAMREYFDTFHYSMAYCCMTPYVTGTARGPVTLKNIRSFLNNPYWLGREAWRNIRARFNRTLIGQDLTLVERDRRFIEYARTQVIGKFDDREFLRLGLDDDWIRKYKLAVLKPLDDRSQWDPSLPPPRPGEFQRPHQYQIVSNDGDVVRLNIINEVKDLRSSFPRVFLTDFDAEEKGVIALELLDEFGKKYPLDMRTVSPTLYVMAKIMRKPVSMESTYLDGDLNQIIEYQAMKEQCPHIIEQVKIWEASSDPWEKRWAGWYRQSYAYCFNPPADNPFIRIRTTVTPKGEVTVHRVERAQRPPPSPLDEDDKEVPLPELAWGTNMDLIREPAFQDPRRPVHRRYVAYEDLAKRNQEILDGFVANLYLEDMQELDRHFERSASEIAAVPHSIANGYSFDFFDHMPTVAGALSEFATKVSRRLPIAMSNAFKGKTRMWRNGSKIAFQALPSIPYFQFRRKLVELGEKGVFVRTKGPLRERQQNLPQTIKVHASQIPMMREHFGWLLDTAAQDVGPVEGNPPGRAWGEDPSQQEGQGPGDDEDGDPMDGDPNEGAGGPPGDPSIVEIPSEVYARALAEQVELPNLRPKGGLSPEVTWRDRGVANRRNGSPSAPENADRATRLGISSLVRKFMEENPGQPIDYKKLLEEMLKDPNALMRDGYRRFRAQDWHVIDQQPKKKPDINALVPVMVDFSGSMYQWWNLIKIMTFDIHAILKARYPQVKFVFIPFDAKAVAYENLDDFLKVHLGGGTDYEIPMRLLLDEIYPAHPLSQWDRFPIIIGDLIEAKRPSAVEAYLAMKMESQFTTTLHTGTMDWDGWAQFFKDQKASDPFVGYVQIPTPADYYPLLWREAFRNDE